jgi:hypothetical protein
VVCRQNVTCYAHLTWYVVGCNMLCMGGATCYVGVCNLRMVWNPTINVETIGCFVMICFVMIQAPNPWRPTPHIVQIVGNDEYVCSYRVV